MLGARPSSPALDDRWGEGGLGLAHPNKQNPRGSPPKEHGPSLSLHSSLQYAHRQRPPLPRGGRTPITNVLLLLLVPYLFTTDDNVNLMGQLCHGLRRVRSLSQLAIFTVCPPHPTPWHTRKGPIYPILRTCNPTLLLPVRWKQMTPPTGLHPHVECNILRLYC